MIAFEGTKRLYVKGTCSAMLTDKQTGDVVYHSDKFQTGNIQTSMNMGEIRAGLGNGVAAIIPSDSAMQVNFAAADFNLYAKAAQVGGTLNYNAPVMVCQTVTADDTSIKVDVSAGAPVAQLGFSDVFGYVQEVGVASPITTYGVSYPIDPETGVVDGFNAESGKKYKVWYFVNKASAQMATIGSLYDPKVFHFTAQMAVYANDVSGKNNSGTRVGWLYAIVPCLKLGGTANVTGDQTTPDTTSISGQAVIADQDVVSENCEGCGGGNVYAYYVYVPDDESQDVAGVIAAIGGVISAKVSTTVQVQPRLYMANGETVRVTDYAKFTYKLTGAPSGTAVSETGLITAGATTGDCDLEISYTVGEETFTDTCTLSVVTQ